MPFQSVPGVAEAIVRYQNNNVISTLTFYGQHLPTYDQDDIDDLAEAVDGWAGTSLRPMLAGETTYLDTNVRGLTDPVDFAATRNAGTGAGAIVGEQMPAVVAFAVKRVSGLAGRSARGRVYMPVPANNLGSDENTVTTAQRDLFVTNLNLLRVAMLAAGWTEVIVSRYTLGAVRPFGITYVVTAYQAFDLFLDTQRRRAPDK